MMEFKGKGYREIRCTQCRKLLGWEYVFAGRLAFACPRCAEITILTIKHLAGKNNSMETEFIENLPSKGGEI